MKYKILNNTDLRVSALALGTDVYGSALSEDISYELLDFFTESGGNLIDTALLYGEGKSERLIGKWMKERQNRGDLIISTKGAHPKIMTKSRLSGEEILFDIEQSLKNLGTDYVDIYWLHRDDESLPEEPIMDTLFEIIQSGKARYIGMSNWTNKRIDAANRYAKACGKPLLIGSQIQYSAAIPNIKNNDPTLVLMNEEEYKYFSETKLNVFAYASQAKGFFSKLALGGEAALSPKARERYLNDKSLARFEKIHQIAKETGKTVGEIAIALISGNPNFLTVPIVGCKNTAQLKESISGSCLSLRSKELLAIHDIIPE